MQSRQSVEIRADLRRLSIIFLVIISSLCLLCVGACGSQHNAALVELSGAIDAKYSEAAHQESLHYRMKVDYPALDALDELTIRMKTAGWVKRPYDSLNPGLPSSHISGWTDYIDATKNPEMRVYQWLAEWQNTAGDIVTYVLQYEVPPASPSPGSDLQIYAIYRDKGMLAQQIETTIRDMMQSTSTTLEGAAVPPAHVTPVQLVGQNIMLVRNGDHCGALQLVESNEDSATVRWWFQTAPGESFNGANSKSGTSKLFEKYETTSESLAEKFVRDAGGETCIEFGAFKLGWSGGNWIYPIFNNQLRLTPENDLEKIKIGDYFPPLKESGVQSPESADEFSSLTGFFQHADSR